MKYKKKYHTVEIVPKYGEKKSWKEAKSRSLTHTNDRALSWHGTGTSIKCDGVKLVLWAQTCPLSEMMNTIHILFIMACCYI